MHSKKLSSENLRKIYESESTSCNSEEVKESIEKLKSKLLGHLSGDTDSNNEKQLGKSDEGRELLKERLGALCNHFLPHYIKADRLADKYQKKFRLASISIYLMAALAVLIVSGQYIFAHYIPESVIFGEIALMVMILLVIFIGKRFGWHRRWLDYRFIAERLRFGLFVAFLVDNTPESCKECFHGNWLNDSWCITLYKEILSKKPAIKVIPSDSLISLKDFFHKAWLEDQKKYHIDKKTRELKKHEIISRMGEVFYGLTLLAAIFHVTHFGHHFIGEISGQIWTFFAIAFPITGSALSALRAHFDYKKIAKRSNVLAGRLDDLQKRLANVTDMEGLQDLVCRTEALMHEENADWHVSMEIHVPEIPA